AVDAITNTPSTTATATIQVGGVLNLLPATGSVATGGTYVVKVNLANANSANSGGLVTFSVGINYDPAKFSVSATDVIAGSLLNAAGVDPAWKNGFGSNTTASGHIDILANGPAILTTTGG